MGTTAFQSVAFAFIPSALTRVAAQHPRLTRGPDDRLARAWAATFSRDRGFEPDVRFAFDDLPMRLRMVETDDAIGRSFGRCSAAGVFEPGPERAVVEKHAGRDPNPRAA